MEKLKLDLGKEITLPIYISPVMLEQKPDEFGSITLVSEKEIFIERSLIGEKEIQTELSSGEITNWEEKLKNKDSQINQLSKQVEELKTERDGLEEKHNQLRTSVSNILYPEIEETTLAENDTELVNQAKTIVERLKLNNYGKSASTNTIKQ